MGYDEMGYAIHFFFPILGTFYVEIHIFLSNLHSSCISILKENEYAATY